MKTNPQANPIKIPSAKSNDQPATRGMLKIVRLELKEEIKKSETRLSKKMDAMTSKMNNMAKKFRIELSDLKIMIHNANLLSEVQQANNRIVLEGLQALWQRQDKIENKHN